MAAQRTSNEGLRPPQNGQTDALSRVEYDSAALERLRHAADLFQSLEREVDEWNRQNVLLAQGAMRRTLKSWNSSCRGSLDFRFRGGATVLATECTACVPRLTGSPSNCAM